MRHTVFAALLALHMVGFVLVPELQQRNWLLYLTALSAHAFVFDTSAWRRAFLDRRGLALLVLVAFPLLSLVWSDTMVPRDIRALLVAGYCIVAIYFGVAQLIDARPRDVERLKLILLGAAILGAALAVGNWIISDQRGVWRLKGLLGLDNPVHASILLLAVTLPAIRRISLDRTGLAWFAACILPWTFVLLAGSRAAVAAYLVVVVVLRARLLSLRRSLMAGACVAVLGAALLALIGVDVFYDIWLARGLSYRGEIWSQVWARYTDCNALIGCGIGSPLNFTFAGVASSRPHSILLGALYYQGILGLLVFLAALAYLAYRALWHTGDGTIDAQDWAVMLVYALLANLTSGDHILVRATLFWSYFWLPVMVLAALRSSPSGTGRPP